MDIVVHNFFLMEKNGEIIKSKEFSVSESSTHEDFVLRTAISRVANNLGSRVMALGYQGVDHYIRNFHDSILVIGMQSNQASKSMIKKYLNRILEETYFKKLIEKKKLDYKKLISDFEQLFSIIINQLVNSIKNELEEDVMVQLNPEVIIS